MPDGMRGKRFQIIRRLFSPRSERRLDNQMKSVIELEINVPRAKLAELFADPKNNTKWMDDLERYEPLSGTPGRPGSKYCLVPKTGDMVFIATVIARDLPHESRLILESSKVVVSVTDKFVALSSEKTKLISEEVFSFKGLFNKIYGFLVQRAIKNAHRRHMEGFKCFAEAQR